MKICLDGRVIGGALSGIPRLALNLIRRLIEFGTDHEFTVIVRPGLPEGHLPARGSVRFLESRVPPYSLREQYRIPLLLRKVKCDLYHSFTYAAPLLRPCRTILSVYDLIPLEFPQYVGFVRATYVRRVTGAVARGCWRIMTISEYSKRSICDRFGVAPEKVFVAPAAVDERFFAEGNSAPCAPERGFRYILNVSNKWPHKNAAAVVETLKRIERKCDHKLVFVGQQNRRVIELIAQLRLTDRVLLQENVSDEDLVRWYRGADVFVFPSLSEGFGMTPLEAMACGAPTVSSPAGSLAEVLGDAAVLVNPHDVEGMAEAVLKVLSDEALRRRLVEKGRERARLFRWDDAARKVLAVYREASVTG